MTTAATLGTETGTQVNQYLTFTLGSEEYGIEILKVQEIKGYTGITPIPNTPPYIRGVMNLRGTVIPVVDLRVKFSMEEQAYDKFTVIIVVTVRDKVIGVVVDAVSDVLDVAASQIRETPDLGARADVRFIGGMATVGEKLVVLLDIEKLLSAEEMSSLTSAA
ncbi:MAG: purine-binding chemotaxis protein CheW [Bryobacteraceae bacterium]|nr:purine-binding chemotaxis protein CheW [Bryobacteraceae bacterium]